MTLEQVGSKTQLNSQQHHVPLKHESFAEIQQVQSQAQLSLTQIQPGGDAGGKAVKSKQELGAITAQPLSNPEGEEAKKVPGEEEEEEHDLEDDDDGDDKKKQQKIVKKFVWYQGVQCKKAWFIFSQQNIIRRIAYRIIKHDQFETIILIAIIISSLKLVFDTYLKTGTVTDSQQSIIEVGDIIDRVFTIFFALEAFTKALALGFVLNDGSYLRESW